MIGCSHEGMWLGLLYSPSTDRDEVILSAWASAGGRPLTVAGRLDDAPDIARALRNADPGCAWAALPRCDACCTPLDLPPL